MSITEIDVAPDSPTLFDYRQSTAAQMKARETETLDSFRSNTNQISRPVTTLKVPRINFKNRRHTIAPPLDSDRPVRMRGSDISDYVINDYSTAFDTQLKTHKISENNTGLQLSQRNRDTTPKISFRSNNYQTRNLRDHFDTDRTFRPIKFPKHDNMFAG